MNEDKGFSVKDAVMYLIQEAILQSMRLAIDWLFDELRSKYSAIKQSAPSDGDNGKNNEVKGKNENPN